MIFSEHLSTRQRENKSVAKIAKKQRATQAWKITKKHDWTATATATATQAKRNYKNHSALLSGVDKLDPVQ